MECIYYERTIDKEKKWLVHFGLSTAHYREINLLVALYDTFFEHFLCLDYLFLSLTQRAAAL